MKHNWEYKNIEECLEKVPVTSKLQTKDFLSEGVFPIVSQEADYVSGYWNNESDVVHLLHPVVVFGDHSRVVKYIDFDFVVGADGVKILSPKDFLNPKFLYYFVKSADIPSLGYSRHYKLLREKDVPIPPLSEQSRIVVELDLLTGIIDKQKAQLKELDTLAQSIFYDMFGDPIENPKGWKMKKLGDVCNVGSSRRIFANEYVESGVPFYRSKEVIEKSKNKPISVELFISQERCEQLKQENGIPSVGDLLITAVGTIGEIWVVDSNQPFYFKDGNIIWLSSLSTLVSPSFFKFSLEKLIAEYKKKMTVGSAYSALTIVNLKKMEILLPPLALQQSFADKIQSIENQKAKIKTSIADTQKLLDYTMDKYFG